MADLREGEHFYVWPVIDGKGIQHQWGEIRQDTAEAKPVVENAWLDVESGIDLLNAEKVLSGFNFGELDFRNKFRLIYRKSNSQLCVQKNDNTVDDPDWEDCWCVNFSNGQFQVTSEGGIYSSSGFYGTLPDNVIDLVGEAGTAGGTEFERVSKLFFNSDHGFYLSSIKDGPNAGSPLVNQAYPFGRAKVFTGLSGVEWQVEHNFSTSPVMVQVMDNNDRVVIPDVIDVSDPNTAYFYFDSSFDGKAYISSGGTGAIDLLGDDFFTVDLPTGEEQKVYLDTHAAVPYNIQDVAIRCESGSATVGFYIKELGEDGDGISVQGLDPVSVTTSMATAAATGAKAVAKTNEVTMAVYNSNNAVHLRGTIRIKRT